MGANSFVLDQSFSVAAIVQSLASFFEVSSEEVYVSGYTPLNRFSRQHKPLVYLEQIHIGPEFPSQWYLATDGSLPNPEDIPVIQALCRHLKCRALIECYFPPDERQMMSVQWLILPEGGIFRVTLEGMPLEEEPARYVINKTVPMTPITWHHNATP